MVPHAQALALLLLTITTLITKVTAQVDPTTSRLCNSATRCNECIIADPRCVWCADPEYNGIMRCYVNGDPGFTCNSLQNPVGTVVTVSTPSLGDNNPVTPSRVNVTFRPGAPISFPLTVQSARNFPVDVYLLMDLSASMRDDLEHLKRLGSSVADEIADISSDFRIGFGSFVDKRVSPFVSLDINRQEDPCLSGCVSTYSYRHHVDLTDDSQFFGAEVDRQANISGNQDSTEGGFDGMLQSVVCTDLIGWRDVSRKLLIFITDAGFHIAGDGKLGGVILPNDGSCKISGTTAPQDYNDWITLDYPSIGQIAQTLRANEIIPIFAAQANALPVYQSLVRELGEGAFSGTLDRDSGNILELLRDSYNNVSQKIVFDRQQVPTGVSVDIQLSSCPGPVAGGICTGVLIENNATFNVVVTLQECTPDNSGTVQVPIRVVGFGTFTFNLETICTCPCDTDTSLNSPTCNSNGTLECGHCDCNPGRFGEFCQCDATGQGGVQQICPLGPTEVQCTSTDRGTCMCGECVCKRDQAGFLFFGPACECNRDDCPSFNGELCSGRGECTCTGCRCNVEPSTQLLYTGNACECSPVTDCVDPNNALEICNGRGTCDCSGQCYCTFPYLGDYCELCSGNTSCLDNLCQSNRECTACAIELLDLFTDAATFFSIETLTTLPNETTLKFDVTTKNFQLHLPRSYCPETCSQDIVIISGTNDVDYIIDNQMATRCEYIGSTCTHRYYVAVHKIPLQFTDVHVEFRKYCSQVSALAPTWVVAAVVSVTITTVLSIALIIMIKLLIVTMDNFIIRKLDQQISSIRATLVIPEALDLNSNQAYGQAVSSNTPGRNTSSETPLNYSEEEEHLYETISVCGDESLDTTELQSNNAYGQTQTHLEVDPALQQELCVDLQSNMAYEQVAAVGH
ncbi:integrin beta-1-like isoform X1 [Halichondria panicea]|uniref:integrin beta-1-like isoform X1 n=1 Tax=Halichondria panicea TaxID=6063 RepID=UPI00312B9EC2